MEYEQKDNRIDLRIKDSEKSFLIYAASLQHMKLSAFVLQCAMKEAEDLVAKTPQFVLPEKKWKAFRTALDRPAKSIPKLKKLLTEPSVFDE